MTSSLVGSEMCIRDRNKIPEYSWGSASACACMLCKGSAKQFGTSLPIRICLLYTSDAADDM
eukprot:12772614-Prorocentrum_lima.AAC.1